MYEGAIYPFLIWISLLFFAAWFLDRVTSKTKSREYREMLSDVYVAGRIRQVAKEDNVDLTVELKDMAKFLKMSRVNLEALDQTIERELQEKISKDKVKEAK